MLEKRDEWLDAESEAAPAETQALLEEREEIDVAYKVAQMEKEAATVFMDRWRIANRRQVPLVDRELMILLRLFRLGADPGRFGWATVDERNGGTLGGNAGSKSVAADTTGAEGSGSPGSSPERGDAVRDEK